MILRNVGILHFATRAIDQGQWPVLEKADVVVVHIDAPTAGQGYCLDPGGDTAYGDTPAQFRAQAEAFLEALTARVDPDRTIIRVGLIAILPGFHALWAKRGVVEECTAGWIALNQQWTEAAAIYGGETVDIRAAWNGPAGEGDAPAGYFADEIGHLSGTGAAAAAALIRGLGYAPLAP